MRGSSWSRDDITNALDLVSSGLSDYEVSRRTGIPRSTILNWRRGQVPSLHGPHSRCSRCADGGAQLVPASSYAYLLGQYLGDGCLFKVGQGSYGLRIYSDASYPGIIDECCEAIEAIRGRRPYLYGVPNKRLITLTSCWKCWRCLFPQHGPGKKHLRTVVLAPWQVEIVERDPGTFARGLIHSDGWRGLNRVTAKGRRYSYPRYQFSSRSDDIRQLFIYVCALLDVECRLWGKYHVSVARRASVRRLDEFVGPKS